MSSHPTVTIVTLSLFFLVTLIGKKYYLSFFFFFLLFSFKCPSSIYFYLVLNFTILSIYSFYGYQCLPLCLVHSCFLSPSSALASIILTVNFLSSIKKSHIKKGILTKKKALSCMPAYLSSNSLTS